MNRYKQEEKRKHDEARKGLSQDEINALDLEEEINQQVESLARRIHVDKFPEEYDHMYDSVSEAKQRAQGINPMSQAYISKISDKRSASGVAPLAENGMPVSDDTYHLCVREAQAKLYSDIHLKRPPASACVFCKKTLRETAGKRLVAQHFRGVKLTTQKYGGGHKDYPHRCFELFSDPVVYMDCWGEKEKWTEAAILSAKEAYLSGKRPWFCQICGGRTCSECGSPINYPVGSDILYGNGGCSHAPFIPADPGCINPQCKKYKAWGNL